MTETSGSSTRKIIVEVGPGNLPIHRLSPVILEEGSIYVGIDNNGDIFKNTLQKYYRVGGEIIGDLTRLPLQTESVDEAWLLNVFGEYAARRLPFYSVVYKDSNNRPVLSTSIMIFLKETARVLKLGGKAYIGEYYTPAAFLTEVDFKNFGLDSEVFSGDRIKDFLKRHGLDKIEEIWGRNLTEDNFHESFFLVLTKNP